MTDMLHEYCDSRGATIRVDRQAGIIRGVKILGLKSKNGRAYSPNALTDAARLYEDAKVNVNHPKNGPASPRDYQDRIGSIRSVAMRPGEGLFGDFHFNPKHALAEQLIWDAEHSPENVGFSHNVEARLGRQGDLTTVEAILRVQSVDLVADPATTQGLFESATTDDANTVLHDDATYGTMPETAATEGDLGGGADLNDFDELKQKYPALIECIRAEHAEEVNQLRSELERLTDLHSRHSRLETARRLLREYGLPDATGDDPTGNAISSERFMESLIRADDEAAMRELLEDRARLVRAVSAAASRPQSVDQHTAAGIKPFDAKAFVEAIT